MRSHGSSAHGPGQGAPIHAALLHAGDDEFVARLAEFALDGLAADEPVVVVARPERTALLRDALADDAEYVTFVDLEERAANPSRVVSVWSDLALMHRRPGRRVRGIGELVWDGRTPDELVECRHREALLNAAADDLRGLTLVCPYDAAALPEPVLDGARRTHPVVVRGACSELSDAYEGTGGALAALRAPLPDPPLPYDELAFDSSTLADVPPFVAANGDDAGLDRKRRRDLVVAVGEAAVNSVVHGGGRGVVRSWVDDDGDLVHEVRDAGVVDDLLAGCHRPDGDGSGWGLWLVHELCDLVQLRSSDQGTVVRMHVRCG